jgi:uncharacterized protein YndB with AHSA1/START domain
VSDRVSGAGVLRMARVVPAPRERVFRAWTDPDELKRWWGPGRFTTLHAEIDLRPGGRYLLVMQPPDGTPLRLAGTYREVQPPERLVYTWRWEDGVPETGETLVEVEFRDRGDQTEIMVVHRGFPAGSPQDPYRLGWQSGLGKLATLLDPGEPSQGGASGLRFDDSCTA